MPTRTKFTAEIREKCLEGARIGAPASLCAEFAGIDKATISRWLEKGRNADPDSPYGRFYAEFTEAKAHPKVRALGLAYRAMPDNPALTWKYIERQVPGFSPPQPGPPPAPTQILIQLGLNDGRPAVPTTVIEGEADVSDLSALPDPAN